MLHAPQLQCLHVRVFVEVLAGFRWHDANTSSVQLARRRQERLRVQQQHFERTESSRVPSERTLNVMARLYQGKRVLKRF